MSGWFASFGLPGSSQGVSLLVFCFVVAVGFARACSCDTWVFTLCEKGVELLRFVTFKVSAGSYWGNVIRNLLR